MRTIHHGYTPEIEVLDGRLAADVRAMMDEIRDRSLRLVLRGWSRYHETYEHGDAGRLIKGARIACLRVQYGVTEIRRRCHCCHRIDRRELGISHER